MLGVNGLSVVSSYVGRDFITAIELRNMPGFIGYATLYVSVFAASTVAAVVYRYAEEKLGLLWREWLTRRLVTLYLENRIYYHLSAMEQVANPDQRIADDVRAYTSTTLSFILIVLNAAFAVIAFSSVLWSISPLLFAVAALYSILGSLIAIALGRPLARLNYDQSDKEANLRTELIHLRDCADSIALMHREEHFRLRVLRRVGELSSNFGRIIAVNRNLGFFATGYNYLIQIIPALIVAPLFIRGKVEFGVITQSAIAFSHIVGAFSLIVTQFQSISLYVAVIARVSALGESMQQAGTARGAPDIATLCDICLPATNEVAGESKNSCIDFRECGGRITYEQLSLRSPEGDVALLKELSLSVPNGARVLVTGTNEAAKAALFRATAGMWSTGTGRIYRPPSDEVFFIPERPYLPPGTLRQLLLRTTQPSAIADESILTVMRDLDIGSVVARVGGLDVERNWSDILTPAERQLAEFTRLLLEKPPFAFIARPLSVLNAQQAHDFMQLLSDLSISYIIFGGDSYDKANYDAVLEIFENGDWTWEEGAGGFKTDVRI